ncbi:unnamed protein product, partial [Prorocentrum cordatum]
MAAAGVAPVERIAVCRARAGHMAQTVMQGQAQGCVLRTGRRSIRRRRATSAASVA